MLQDWSFSCHYNAHNTFHFQIHPCCQSICVSPLSIPLPSNWKVIGQVQVAADKACLADVTRKHEHNGSNWTDSRPFYRHRWTPIEGKEIIQYNGWGKRFPFRKWPLAWMHFKSVQVDVHSFCLIFMQYRQYHVVCSTVHIYMQLYIIPYSEHSLF